MTDQGKTGQQGGQFSEPESAAESTEKVNSVQQETDVSIAKSELVSEPIEDEAIEEEVGVMPPESSALLVEEPAFNKAPSESESVSEAKISELRLTLENVGQQIDNLQKSFDTKIKYDTTKDKQFDSMYEELREHREDLYFKIIRPLMMDLITDVHDEMFYFLRHLVINDSCSENDKKSKELLSDIIEIIEGILQRYGVTTYVEDSNVFDSKRQRSIKIVTTENKSQDRLVADRLKKGFRYGERVLRPELVATYRLTEALGKDIVEGDS